MTRIAVPPDLPWFDGHFPGRPVLPGVAQLAMLDDLLRAGHPALALAGLPRVRFRKEIVPGDTIDLEVVPGSTPDTVRFAVRRDGESACDGIARVREAGAAGLLAPGTEPLPAPSLEYPPVATLLPHAGTMRLLSAIVSAEETRTIALALVVAGSPLARDGRAPVVLALEMAAQAAAATEAHARARQTGVAAPREGRVVGVSDAVFVAAHLPEGRPLVVAIERVEGIGAMTVYRAAIADGGRLLASANVSTYLV